MREIVHLQAGQCGNQIGAKVGKWMFCILNTEWSYFVEKYRVSYPSSRGFVSVLVPQTTPWDYHCPT